MIIAVLQVDQAKRCWMMLYLGDICNECFGHNYVCALTTCLGEDFIRDSAIPAVGLSVRILVRAVDTAFLCISLYLVLSPPLVPSPLGLPVALPLQHLQH